MRPARIRDEEMKKFFGLSLAVVVIAGLLYSCCKSKDVQGSILHSNGCGVMQVDYKVDGGVFTAHFTVTGASEGDTSRLYLDQTLLLEIVGSQGEKDYNSTIDENDHLIKIANACGSHATNIRKVSIN